MSATERLDAIEARLARISDPDRPRIERAMGKARLHIEDVPALVAALRAVLDVLDTAAAEYRTTADRLAAESIDRSIPREDRPAADDVIRYSAYSGAAAGAARRAREAIAAALDGAA